MSYSTAFSQAIVTVVFVADKIRQNHFEFVPSSNICSSLNLKAPTLVKILQALLRAGIIETKEGKSVGVRLKKSSDKITFLDIFEAIESSKPLFQLHLDLTAKGQRPDKAKKELIRVLKDTEMVMRSHLAQTKVSDFLKAME